MPSSTLKQNKKKGVIGVPHPQEYLGEIKSIKAWALVVTKHAGKGRIFDGLSGLYYTKKKADEDRKYKFIIWKKSLKVLPVLISPLPQKGKRKIK